MANNYFNFKQFRIMQGEATFKVGTDGVLLGAYADISGAGSVLDIGTGTGLIAIMLAQRCEARITAIEPDRNSYLQCVENVQRCKWKERITIEHKSLQQFTPGIKFDLIVTNPPYFTGSLRSPDPGRTASRHNDLLTNDELLSGVSILLDDHGKFQLILPYAEGNIFIAGAGGYGLFCNNILKIRPLPTSGIRRLILTFSRRKTIPSEKFLTIEHGRRHEFTDEYISLTKDFYLKF
jgi:tRNA1Val (adenine37-N6)-methyltransferase